MPGEHNVLNGLAALAAASHLGIASETIARALGSFKGARRRLEVRGASRGVTVLDDYAHHPTQIAATLKAVRQKYGQGEVWAVFQPHTYSRLRVLWSGFATCFADADHVIVLPVYAAREALDPAVRPEQLAQDMQHPDVRFAAGLQEAAVLLAGLVQEGDTVITLGAGDEWRVGDHLLTRLRKSLARTLHTEECSDEQEVV
jgi:UDP-N-acetylmuramate--alanine ligase